MSRYLWLCTLLLLPVSTILSQYIKEEQKSKINTEIFSGTFFYKLPLIPYETSVPISFALEIEKNLENITTFKNERPCSQNKKSSACKLETDLQIILSHLQLQLNLENEDWKIDLENENLREENLNRQRRGLDFMASFLSWCCDVANINQLKGVIQNQNGVINTVNNMVDLTGQDNENLILTAKNFNNFTMKVKNLTTTFNSSLNTLQKEINNIRENPEVINQVYVMTHNTLKFLYLNYYFDNMRNLKESCLQNKIPHSAIPKKILLQELRKLNKILKPYNQKVAFDLVTEIDLLYKLQLTTCFHNISHIIINVQIPIIGQYKNIQTLQNVPIPLLWENKLCKVTKEKYIIISSTQQFYVLQEDHKECDKSSYPLCQLPRHTLTDNPDYYCIKSILQQKPIKILKQVCQFICNNMTEEPVITKIAPNKFLLTNIKTELSLDCDQENLTTVFPNKTTGTLEILIPCHCELKNNETQILLKKIHPCDKSDYKDPKISHLIPEFWTIFNTLDTKSMEKDRHAFTDESQILNNNWSFEINTLHLADRYKVQKKVHIINSQQEIFDTHELFFYIIGAWLLLLTLIALVAFYFILMNSAKITMLAPPQLPAR